HIFEKFGSDLSGRRSTTLKTRPSRLRVKGWGTHTRGALGAEFERVVSGAGVAIGERSDAEEKFIGCGNVLAAQPVLFVHEGAAEKFDDLRGGERFEHIHFGARQQRGNDFEGGIFRGGADEDDVAGFDVRKKGVLLGLVEAVDFIHEY